MTCIQWLSSFTSKHVNKYIELKLTVASALTICRLFFFFHPLYIEENQLTVYLKGTKAIIKCCKQIFLMSEEQTIQMKISLFHSLWINAIELRKKNVDVHCSRSFKIPELIRRIPVAKLVSRVFLFFGCFFFLLPSICWNLILCFAIYYAVLNLFSWTYSCGDFFFFKF